MEERIIDLKNEAQQGDVYAHKIEDNNTTGADQFI